MYRFFSKPENNRALTLVTNGKFLVFDVRVCSQAVIIISNNPDIEAEGADYYEVHLGEDNNRM